MDVGCSPDDKEVTVETSGAMDADSERPEEEERREDCDDTGGVAFWSGRLEYVGRMVAVVAGAQTVREVLFFCVGGVENIIVIKQTGLRRT